MSDNLAMNLEPHDEEPARELKAWEPLELSPMHKYICALAANGLGTNEIAEITNYSVSRVSVIKNHPDAERLIAKLTTDLVMRSSREVRRMIDVAAVEAMQKNIQLMRSSNERISQISVFDILDRAGYKPADVNVNANFMMEKDEVSELRQTLQDMNTPIPVRPPLSNAVEILVDAESDAKISRGDGA